MFIWRWGMSDICDERHKRIDEKLNEHDTRLNNLEQYKSRTEVEIKNLIEQIKSLVTTMRWFMGLFASSLIGFFIWYVQNIGR